MTLYDETCARILVLSEQVWEGRVKQPDIDDWLENFKQLSGVEENERDNALHLLAHFNHFGLREIRVLLAAMFRDHFRYPLIQAIRASLDGTRDASQIEKRFEAELAATRFLGMGNPSESGSHLLYYFRQVNGLPKELFVNQHQLLDGPADVADIKLSIPELRRIVFIDDVLGSGQQSREYSHSLLPTLFRAARNSATPLEILYLVLFAKPEGLRVARSNASLFTQVRAVHELDDSEMAFTETSRVYADPPVGVSRGAGERIARWYGGKLFPGHALGYRNGQMLLGLHHNVPDNTLPVFWTEGTRSHWLPIFKRYSKEV